MQNKKQVFPGAMIDQIIIGGNFNLPLDDLFDGDLDPPATNESSQHPDQLNVALEDGDQGPALPVEH